MSKEYRNIFNFSNQQKFIKYLGSKDLTQECINFDLIEKQNKRLVEIFETINKILKNPSSLNIEKFVCNVTADFKRFNHFQKLNNRGRAYEEVFNSWLMGILAERVFKETLEQEVGFSLEHNGDDDWTNEGSFNQTRELDFINKDEKITVDVVCGKTKSPFHIKIHKKNQSDNNPGFKAYQFSVNIFNGTHCLTSINSLEEKDFIPNPSMEGTLCYEVSEDKFKKFYDHKKIKSLFENIQ